MIYIVKIFFDIAIKQFKHIVASAVRQNPVKIPDYMDFFAVLDERVYRGFCIRNKPLIFFNFFFCAFKH